MATKPTKLGQWATDLSADVVEPSAGKKAIGWGAGERPPNSYFNWWMNTIYDWMQYLNDGVFASGDLETPDADLKHGNRSRMISLASSAAVVGNHPDGKSWITSSSSDKLHIPIEVDIGQRIKEFHYYYYEVSGSTSLKLYKNNAATAGTPTQLGTTQTSPGTGSGAGVLSVTGLTETVADGYIYYAEITVSAAGTDGYGAKLITDRV